MRKGQSKNKTGRENGPSFAYFNCRIPLFQLAGMADCFPPPLVIFPNGVAYEYFRGRNLDGYDLIKPEVIR